MFANWLELVGKKIVGFRGVRINAKTKVELQYALFDDEETILTFNEQDSYDYHDCCNSARILNLEKNKELWKRMFEKHLFQNKSGFDEPTWSDF